MSFGGGYGFGCTSVTGSGVPTSSNISFFKSANSRPSLDWGWYPSRGAASSIKWTSFIIACSFDMRSKRTRWNGDVDGSCSATFSNAIDDNKRKSEGISSTSLRLYAGRVVSLRVSSYRFVGLSSRRCGREGGLPSSTSSVLSEIRG